MWVVLHILEELWQAVIGGDSVWLYLKDEWNWITMGRMASSLCFVFWTERRERLELEDCPDPENKEQYGDEECDKWAEFENKCYAIAILLAWFGLIGMMRFIKPMRIFSSLLMQCIKDMIPFIVFLTIFLFGFAFTFYFT